MLDRERVLEVAFTDDDVEPAASVVETVPGEVLSGQANHPGLLPGIDRVDPLPVGSGAPGFHLHEDQDASRLGDEIELPETRTMVPGEDAIALPAQPPFGFGLTGTAQGLAPT